MTELETDLRAALHQRAVRVHASPNLLVTNYQPRPRGLRPRSAAAW